MSGVGRHFQQIGVLLAEPSPYAVPARPFFDRFCIGFLAVDWIVFGSMHFSMHDATRGMLPSWVPFPDAVVIATGMAEVTAGMLMLYGRTRRIAAVMSLALLVLLVPAVFHILYHESALPFPADSVLARVWRLFGIPHNVLMAIFSIHVMKKPYPDPWRADGPVALGGQPLFVGRNASALIVAVILLLCNAAGYLTIIVGVHGDKAIAAMWMMMCLAIGGLLGFLFAVPRANTKTVSRDILKPNRNIEAISDWLTKILVGLGLVNFKEIGAFLTERAAGLAPLLKTDANYALAMIIYFCVAGFLEGYLLTRMFIQYSFEDAARFAALPPAGVAYGGSQTIVRTSV